MLTDDHLEIDGMWVKFLTRIEDFFVVFLVPLISNVDLDYSAR
jgi:hypothetical protein